VLRRFTVALTRLDPKLLIPTRKVQKTVMELRARSTSPCWRKSSPRPRSSRACSLPGRRASSRSRSPECATTHSTPRGCERKNPASAFHAIGQSRRCRRDPGGALILATTSDPWALGSSAYEPHGRLKRGDGGGAISSPVARSGRRRTLERKLKMVRQRNQAGYCGASRRLATS